MLKSYKNLSRWYDALEPDTGAPTAPQQDQARLDDPEDEGPARYPHYIRETEVDPEEARARNEIPADLPTRRSEFTGGWSDWVADRAPGPDDDYTPRDGAVVHFPWPEDDDYDDEPLREREPQPRSLREHPASRRGRVVVVLIVAIVLLALAAAGALYLVQSSGQRAATAPMTPPMQFTAGSAQAGITSGCQAERRDRIVRSAESGGTHSGPDAILAFQYAYYVERSGERARAVVAPDAPISPAPLIQRGIDSVPAGTTHCVRIATVGEHTYSVEVTEYRPGGAPATYNKQTVTTAVIGGRTLITGITAG
ncbi:hypothetical protein IU433_20870 [Nocardia puris]|uniref:DUF8176 domain-containing protein n=1 Tax=Nocardia puris TaxID=208602 RepID=A0A366E1N4_9NOCA|nr:hypothetical protein [Nocardia puris]MBF6209462.1 hypothetical protein [Nocardia puris]MBF6367828.1 hypothetical protein [Nocardia puris]MBF6461480.1 hypothetical protein [Nocardia puris]RBO96276.1 hypothetical protein DFR74_101287 [Nocardia puris]